MSNIPLKTITFPGLDDTYTIPQVDDTLLTAGAAADAKKTGDEITDLKEALTDVSTTLTHKADKDGAVASAEQLLSDIGTEDKAPYLFRATPYDSTRVDEEVVGVSVGWNQLVQNGDFSDGTDNWTATAYASISASNGVLKFTTTSSSNRTHAALQNLDTVIGHKYLCTAKVKNLMDTSKTFVFKYLTSDGYVDAVSVTIDAGATSILETVFSTSVAGTRIGIGINANLAAMDVFEVSNVMLIDLTAWFGSTIADYAYTLEQATAGSGVAFIKALLPGGYIPYSAPTLKSVSGLSGHKFTGFNQWDEVTEDGTWNTTTGAAEANTNNRRNKNPIHVLPNTAYYTNKVLFRFYYDADMNFVLYDGTGANSFTTPANACYMNVRQTKADWDGTNTSINLSDPARNGQYEPYKATTYALDSDLTLRGILKMDSDHRVYADGDVYGSDGTATHRYKNVTLDGTEEWTMYEEGKFFAKVIPVNEAALIGTTNDNDAYWSNKYIFHGNGDTVSASISVDKRFYGQRGYGRFWIYDSTYTTVEALKAALTESPMFITYPLETPTTETADPYASPQNCEPGGTEEYVYAEGGSGVPVGHNSKYQKNLKSELERVSDAVPVAPSANGTYTLKATVTAQGVTYAWESE